MKRGLIGSVNILVCFHKQGKNISEFLSESVGVIITKSVRGDMIIPIAVSKSIKNVEILGFS